MPKVSVIVPVYKAESYLHRCVDSILSQTFTDFELILVDDGSPDNCPAICDEYALLDSRVLVIHQENAGQSVARNRAVETASAQWLCFVDSDDAIHPQMLECLYQAATLSGANLSMGGAVEAENIPSNFFEQQEGEAVAFPITEAALEQLYDSGEHRCWVVWGKLIRTEIVKKIPFTAGRIYEDNAIVCQWLYEAKTVANMRERLYFYMVNPDGTTKSQFTLKKLDYLWALEEKIQFYKKVGYAKLRERFCSAYMTTAVNYRWEVLNELHRQDAADEISKCMRKIYLKNLSFINLPADYRIHVYNAIFPKIMRLYWLEQAGLNTLRRDGLSGLANKAIRYLHRGERK